MRLGRCTGCGLVLRIRSRMRPNCRLLPRTIGWRGSGVHPSTRRYYVAQGLSRLHYLRRFIEFGRQPSVLDMGAGLACCAMAGRNSASSAITAVESDRRQLAALRSRLGEGAAYADLAALPPALRFDLVVLAHVLEHAADPNGCSARSWRGSSPAARCSSSAQRRPSYKANFESHLLFFDVASLRRLLQSHGELIDVAFRGKPAAQLDIVQVYPDRGALRPLKEALKRCSPR